MAKLAEFYPPADCKLDKPARAAELTYLAAIALLTDRY